MSLEGGKLEWKTALFRTDSTNDIINVASIIQGRGFFQNVPGTRRQGVEAGIQYHSTQWFAYAGYSLIDATYQFSADLPSPNNPMADANGNVLDTASACYILIPVFDWIKRCIVSIFLVFFIAFLPLFLQGKLYVRPVTSLVPNELCRVG